MRIRIALVLSMAAALLVAPTVVAQAQVFPQGINSKYAEDGFYDVGLTGVSDLLVDQSAGKVFISDGTSLTVTSLAGAVLATKTLPASVDTMVMSDDGSVVFGLALHTPDLAGGKVTRIDASTLKVTSTPSPVASAATSIAYSAGLVWVLNAGASLFADATLVPLNPADLTDASAGAGPFDAGAYVTQMVASPGVQGALFAWAAGQSPVALYRIDVTGPTSPTATLGVSLTGVSGSIGAVDVAPDGSEVVATYGKAINFLDPTTLTVSAPAFDDPSYSAPDDVKIHGSDDVVGFVDSGSLSPTPRFYFPSTDDFGIAPLYPSTVSGLSVMAGSLGFGANHLYWIARNNVMSAGTNSYTYRLGISTPAHTSAMSISVPKNNGWKYNAAVTVTATLSKVPGADLSGQTVEIYGQKRSGGLSTLGSGTVDPTTGVFSVTFHVKEYTTLTAVFPGTDTYAPAIASTWVKSHLKIKSKALRTKRHIGKYALYHYWQNAIAKNHIAPNHSGSKYFFTWQYYKNGWHTANSPQYVLLNSTSNGYYLLKGAKSVIGIKFRIIGYFKGDKRNGPTRAKPVYLRFTK